MQYISLLHLMSDIPIFYIKSLSMYKVHMHAGAMRQLLYGCAYVRETIHSLKSSWYCQYQNFLHGVQESKSSMLGERERERERERFITLILNIYDHVWLCTCSLSGFLSSNGVIALILLKFQLFTPSSAIINTLVTLRPTVGRLDFFILIDLKMRF